MSPEVLNGCFELMAIVESRSHEEMPVMNNVDADEH